MKKSRFDKDPYDGRLYRRDTGEYTGVISREAYTDESGNLRVVPTWEDFVQMTTEEGETDEEPSEGIGT